MTDKLLNLDMNVVRDIMDGMAPDLHKTHVSGVGMYGNSKSTGMTICRRCKMGVNKKAPPNGGVFAYGGGDSGT